MYRDPKRHIFLVLEGIDGTGKTTIARQLSNAISGQYIKSPPEPFAVIKQHVLETATPTARFTYFLCSNIQLSSLAESLLDRTHVVTDRYIWSTIAYHAAIENIPPMRLKHLVTPFQKFLMMPDFVIYLMVSREVQLLRLKDRVDDELQRDLLMSDQFQQRLRKAYRGVRDFFKVTWVEIDTSHMSVSATVHAIEEIIKQGSKT